MGSQIAGSDHEVGLASSFEEELDFLSMWTFLRRHWVLLVAAFVIGGVMGFASSYALQREYRADAVLIAADDFGAGQTNGSASGLGGVAALVGISMPRNNQTQEALATLQSRALIESYISDQKLLPLLFPKKWDSERQTWRVSQLSRDPTPYMGFLLFRQKILKVSEDKKTGLQTVSVEWSNPTLAQQWLTDLIARTNAMLRAKAIERSNRNLAYLNEQVERTAVVELRAAIYKLIEEEIKKQMIAQGSVDYAFRYVDPPVLPEKPIFPKRAMFAFGGAVCVLLFAIVYCRSRPLKGSAGTAV